MKIFKVKLVKNKAELNKVLKIREIVFTKEQKIARELDLDGLDEKARHVIAFYNNKPIGCARIRFLDGKAKLERIALLKQYRGKGFGREIMDYILAYCKKRRISEIYFHSQYHAKEFYKKCGFTVRGKPFLEAGVKHIEMYKVIR